MAADATIIERPALRGGAGEAGAAAAAAAAAPAPRSAEPPTAICTRGDVIVMQDADGYPYTILNTPYNRLRHYEYAGRRIMYAFDGDNVVEETYTPGIFNCRTTGGRLVQISDTAAITTAIVENDRDRYASLCIKWLSATLQRDYIATYVRGSRRLEYDARLDRYVVDGGMFRVDKHGNAEAARHRPDGSIDGYHSLCIVNTEARSDMEVVDPQLGRLVVSEATQMIVGKLMFLLHPSDDKVFLDQLGGTALAHARRLIDAGPPSSTYDAVPRYDDMRGGDSVQQRAAGKGDEDNGGGRGGA